MKIQFKDKESQFQKLRYLVYAIIALFLSFFQITSNNIIDIAGFTPDFVLIFVVWLAITEGRLTGIIAGFACGLMLDFVTFDHPGTNALAKTIAGFIAGSFSQAGKDVNILENVQFIFIVFLTSIFHNLVYFFFYLKQSEFEFWSFFMKFGLAYSVYTTVFAAIAMLLKLPIRSFKK